MKSYIFLTGLLIFVFSACRQPRVHDEGDAPVITLRFDFDTLSFGSIVAGTEFIPLETTDESLIGQVDKIIFQGNKYYVMDDQQKIIFIFDSRGKYLAKIDKKGQGACEYVYMHSFLVDKSGNISILSLSDPVQILSYAAADHYRTCDKLTVKDWSGEDFYPLNTGYIFYSAGGSNDSEKQYFLFSTDLEGNVLNKLLPSHQFIEYDLSYLHSFTPYGDTLLFHKYFDNNIYQILPESVTVRYVLDFGKYRMSEEQKKLFYNKDFQYFMQHANNCIIDLDFWYETPEIAVFSYLPGGSGIPFFALYAKKDKRLFLPKKLDHVTHSLSTPLCMVGLDHFLSVLDVSSIILDVADTDGVTPALKEQYMNAMCHNYPGLKSIIDTLSIDSNPVLIKYKLKPPGS
jgi:hypothetical protein